MSTKPGVTNAPEASIDSRASEVTLPMSSIRPPRMPMSAVAPADSSPSRTVPPRMTRSSMLQFLFIQAAPEQRQRAARDDMPDAPEACDGDHCKVRSELRGDDAEREPRILH